MLKLKEIMMNNFNYKLNMKLILKMTVVSMNMSNMKSIKILTTV